jgi:threonine efflux protein
MTSIAPLVSLFAIGVPTALVPGPTFMVVSQIAMNRSRGQAMLAVLGIMTSGAAWACATLIGLTALFAALPWSQAVLQIAGGCYLVYLGIQLWRSHATSAPDVPAPDGSAYLRGLLTDLMNPKCLAFFASIFAICVPAGAPLWIKLGAVGTVVSVGLLCYGAVAMLFSISAIQSRYFSFRPIVERVCGTVMLLFGVAMLFGGA